MRNDYQEMQVVLNHEIQAPSWADYVDILNDGGTPVRVRQGGYARPVRSGARVPLRSRSFNVFRDDSDQSFVPSGSNPVIALLSSAIAAVTPPPSGEPTELDGQEENVINGAAARIVNWPFGTRALAIKNKSAGTVHVGSTEAEATAAVTPLDPGESIEWEGPLFVINTSGANRLLSVVAKRIRL